MYMLNRILCTIKMYVYFTAAARATLYYKLGGPGADFVRSRHRRLSIVLCDYNIYRHAPSASSSGGLLGRTRRLPCARTKIININNIKRNQILKYV